MTPLPATRDDSGLTLVELIVAVAILGIAFVAVVGGMTTSIVTSATHRDQADGLALLTRAAESVKAAAYTPCATTYPVDVDPGDWSVSVSVDVWNGSAYGPPPPGCPGTDLGLQRIVVSVSWRGTSESVALVKRAP